MITLKSSLLTFTDLVEQVFAKDTEIIPRDFLHDYVDACEALCAIDPGKDHLKATPAILEYLKENEEEGEPDMNGSNQAERDEQHFAYQRLK